MQPPNFLRRLVVLASAINHRPSTFNRLSKNISKMGPEPPENNRPQYKDNAGYCPEVQGEHVMALPEPGLVDETFPVAFHQVIDRIELDQVGVLVRQDLCRPEDGGDPEGKLQEHGDKLAHVPEEDHQGRCQPRKAKQQNYCGEEIVKHLEAVQGNGKPIEKDHGEHHHDKKQMDHQGREDLDDGEHTDAESDLLQEKTVVDNGCGGTLQAFTEKEPGDDAAQHPEDKRVVGLWLGFETHLKNEPENQDINGRVNKSPQYAQI